MKKKKKKNKSYDLSEVKGRKFTTPIGRLSFPALTKAEQYDGKGEAYFKTSILFDKSQDLKAMRKEILLAAAEAFGKNRETWPEVNLPWRDGDEKSDFDGYEGTTYISAKTKNKPVVCEYVNPKNQRALVDDESKIYGGRNARLVLVAKVTESGGKYYVTVYLQGVQLLPGGDPFGNGGVDLENDFDDMEIDSDDDLDDSDDLGDDDYDIDMD